MTINSKLIAGEKIGSSTGQNRFVGKRLSQLVLNVLAGFSLPFRANDSMMLNDHLRRDIGLPKDYELDTSIPRGHWNS